MCFFVVFFFIDLLDPKNLLKAADHQLDAIPTFPAPSGRL
jgi:hypothetical protein